MTARWRILTTGVAALLLACGWAPAWAQAPVDVVETLDEQGKPWTEGVPLTQRKSARELFREANKLVKARFFATAAAKYKEALGLWKHPAFYYNLAIAQSHLDQPMDAYRSLEQALRYGPEPLGEDKYEEASRHLAVLGSQLGRIEIICDEPGAQVMLDGKPLFQGPGRHQIVVRPGGHQLTASKSGRIPLVQQIVVAPGEQARFDLVLAHPDIEVRERPWAVWKPWALVGTGALALLGAGYLDWQSSAEFDAFDQAVDDEAICGNGCLGQQLPASLTDALHRAQTQQWVARATYVTGGALLLTGVVLVQLNGERLVRRQPGDDTAQQMALVPFVGPGGAGFRAQFRF